MYVAWNASVQSNGGRFVYVLDDAYITMAMAKNMVDPRQLGDPRRTLFASCASGVHMWAWLETAAFYIFGPQQIIPLVLNLIGRNYGAHFHRLANPHSAWRPPCLPCFAVLAAIILLTPMALHPVCTGLETFAARRDISPGHARRRRTIAGRQYQQAHSRAVRCIALRRRSRPTNHAGDCAQRTVRRSACYLSCWTTLLILTPLSTMVRYEQALHGRRDCPFVPGKAPLWAAAGRHLWWFLAATRRS